MPDRDYLEVRTNVSKITGEFERVDDFADELGIALDSETENTTKVSWSEEFLGEFVRWVAWETVVQDP